MIYLLVGCLALALITIEILIVSHFHSYSHRLLPLVLGLIVLYDFYLLIEQLTGATDIFMVLKNLLLMQVLDLILYYILDFMHASLKLWQDVFIITVLIVMDFLVFQQVKDGNAYHYVLITFVMVTTLIILATAFSVSNHQEYSEATKRDNRILSLSLIIPAATLILCELHILPEPVCMPIALAITDIILIYMFLADRLRDVNSVLKEELFQTLDVPTFFFDTDYFYLDASEKARELFSEYVEQLEGNPADFSYKENLTEIELSGGSRDYKINGEYYNCVLQPAYFKDKMKGYIVTFHNISSQKEEAEIAMEIARQKSNFLANMSHDLRSPLHAIISGSELVLAHGSEMSLRNKSMIGHIYDAGLNLLDIVNSILDFSKIENGNLELSPINYNFKKLLNEQAHICFTNLGEVPVKFSLEVIDSFPENLYGDELRVRQIIQNILSNAAKFTSEGEIKATFDVSVEDDGRVAIIYTVKDTGIGMTKEQVRKVFGDYVSFADKQKKEGTGLGLSIVRTLAEMMGGYARAESDGEHGSTFTVMFYQELPKADTEIDMHDPMIMSDDNFVYVDEKGEECLPAYIYPEARVLIADDMMVNRHIFANMVEAWKFKLDMAEDGDVAVKMASENHYDLIFLDQMMPHMSGTMAADKIRTFSDTPMVLVTANITEEMRTDSFKHGFSWFMQKPVDVNQLKIVIEEYLPEKLRRKPEVKVGERHSAAPSMSDGYIKALSVYVDELKSLFEILPEYAENDIPMFRNKVHGIKGTSRQLGKDALGNHAEIMEMAAQLNNVDFIERNMEFFMDDMMVTISMSEEELKGLSEKGPQNVEPVAPTPVVGHKLSAIEFREALRNLHDALDSYEMDDIEKAFAVFDDIELEEAYVEALGRVRELYEDMEYDEATEMVQDLLGDGSFVSRSVPLSY